MSKPQLQVDCHAVFKTAIKKLEQCGFVRMVTVVLIPKPEAIKTLVRRRPSDCVVDRLLKPDN